MFEYFREKIANNGILFLQETHSSRDTDINWREDFKGEFFFQMERQMPAASWLDIWVAKKLKLIE